MTETKEGQTRQKFTGDDLTVPTDGVTQFSEIEGFRLLASLGKKPNDTKEKTKKTRRRRRRSQRARSSTFIFTPVEKTALRSNKKFSARLIRRLTWHLEVVKNEVDGEINRRLRRPKQAQKRETNHARWKTKSEGIKLPRGGNYGGGCSASPEKSPPRSVSCWFLNFSIAESTAFLYESAASPLGNIFPLKRTNSVSIKNRTPLADGE